MILHGMSTFYKVHLTCKMYIVNFITYVLLFCFIMNGMSLESCHRCRKKRVLHFPTKTNLAFTMALLKLLPGEKILNTLTEFDVQFPVAQVPYESRSGRSLKDRKLVVNTLIEIANMIGIDGEKHVSEMFCEVKSTLSPPEENILWDILKVIATTPHERNSTICEV